MMVRSRAVSNITTVAAAAASLWCFLVSCGSLSLSSVHAFSTTTPLRCSPCTHIRRHGLGFFSSSQRRIQHQPQSRSFHNYCPLTLESSNSDAERSDASDDKLFDAKTTIALVGGQSLLIGAAAIAAKFVGTPNYGLGPGIDASLPYVLQGLLWSLPLGLLAIALDLVEDKFPALQEVTKATQSSVLSLLGGTFKPVLGIATALALGAAAGIGEEMLFRGVLQFELGSSGLRNIGCRIDLDRLWGASCRHAVVRGIGGPRERLLWVVVLSDGKFGGTHCHARLLRLGGIVVCPLDGCQHERFRAAVPPRVAIWWKQQRKQWRRRRRVRTYLTQRNTT
jgi:hypothetical protein